MVRDSLEAHKDRHAPLLRRFGAALLWRFVVGEAAGEVPPPLPFSSHHNLRRRRCVRLATLDVCTFATLARSAPTPTPPPRPSCFYTQPAAALRALRVREQPLLFEPLLSRHVHALYLAQWGETHDEVHQPQAAA